MDCVIFLVVTGILGEREVGSHPFFLKPDMYFLFTSEWMLLYPYSAIFQPYHCSLSTGQGQLYPEADGMSTDWGHQVGWCVVPKVTHCNPPILNPGLLLSWALNYVNSIIVTVCVLFKLLLFTHLHGVCKLYASIDDTDSCQLLVVLDCLIYCLTAWWPVSAGSYYRYDKCL